MNGWNNNMYKRIIWMLLMLLALLGVGAAWAEEAQDVTAQCALSASVNQGSVRNVCAEKIDRCWDGMADGTLTVRLPAGKMAQGVSLSFFCDVPHLVVCDADGTLLADWNEPYYNAWIPFSRPSAEFTIRRAEKGEMVISRMQVMTPGELPGWVQRWSTLEGDAELLLIATHPDDDILWFGGLLPTYAGERRMKVQVAYMVGGLNRIRRIELLNALWHCGVRYYPEIGRFEDWGSASMITAYEAWGGENAVDLHITRLLRKWNPRVVVTQDLKGEYGHNHHQITTKAVAKAVTALCQDAAYDASSAELWGVADPQKLYIHLYENNQVEYDWEQPLSAFDGKDGLTIAREAFLFHVSQQTGRYHVSVRNAYNCALFGLYYTQVGPDVIGEDLFENIP